MLVRGALITKPEYQKVMQKIIRDFESQLRSVIQTTGDATLMEGYPASWIVSFERLIGFDDCRQWIPELSCKAEEVEKGNEGCTVTIELL